MSPAGRPSDYRAPRWLRNPHLQSVLGSSLPRRRMAGRALSATGATTAEHLVDGGDGIRLQGLLSTVPGREPLGLALLLHGWEGSAESTYMRLSAARLLARGFDVFRLNFRDHGDTHHLNPGIFHSCLIDEVVQAARDVARRFQPDPSRPLRVGGYSLGGNFALRLGLRAPGAGLAVARVAAVCPVLDPAATMTAMERGFPLYAWYFRRKWTRSLRRKRALFPDLLALDERTLGLDLRPLTGWLVERHTQIGGLDAYFDGYSIAGGRLAGLQVPADILTSADDPVIPVAGFEALELPPGVHLEVAGHGGHCGFLLDARMRGYAEHWLAGRLAA